MIDHVDQSLGLLEIYHE